MSVDIAPSKLFRDALAPGHAYAMTEGADVVDRALLELAESAHAAHPQVTLARSAFITYLAARLPPDATSIDALRELRTEDLYLACACSLGDAWAIAILDASYIARVPIPTPGTVSIQDVRQAVREKLLVGQDGAPPKIVEYSGRGDLRGWVRVVAARTSLNLARSTAREVSLDDELLIAERGAAPHDATLRHLKLLYRKEFEEAFRQALAGLDVRDRNMLRQHYIDHVPMERIGDFYQIHRVTVVRRLKEARNTLASETRQHLKAKLRVTRGELESIMRLIQSHLDVSLRGYLPEDEREAR
jgi:RNA polymerase sigma-70 factor (ECF subfamily)